MQNYSAGDADAFGHASGRAWRPFGDGGHVAPGSTPVWRTIDNTAGTIALTKLSVGPMDNNCYILADLTVGSGIIVDAAAEADRILAAVGDIGITAVVTTHGHPDHWQALAGVARSTGARVLHHEADASMIAVPADGRIDHGDRVSVGGSAVEVLHTPGHTPGSVCLVLRGAAQDRPDIRTHLLTGDTLFPGGPGRTTTAADFTRIMTSLRERLFVLDDDTWVYPGHGDDTVLGEERDKLDEWQARGW